MHTACNWLHVDKVRFIVSCVNARASSAGCGAGAGGDKVGVSESTQTSKLGATVMALASLALQRSLLALADTLQLLCKKLDCICGSFRINCSSSNVVLKLEIDGAVSAVVERFSSEFNASIRE